jgi:predicted permease
LRRFAFGAGVRDEVERELAAHLEHSVRDLIAAGFDPIAAADEARRRFGDLERFRDACQAIDSRRRRELRRAELWQDLLQDLRLAARGLRRSPGFAAAAALTLSLGIGANVAVFSVVYGVLLKPLPFPNPDRLAMLWEKNPDKGWTAAEVAPANFLDWRQSGSSFRDITAFEMGAQSVAWTGNGEPRVLRAAAVAGNFFDVLERPPARGRGLRMEESWQGHPVAVLSDRLWRQDLGADPSIIGRTLRLRDVPYTVVGVMPPGFSYPFSNLDLWLPMGWRPADREAVWFRRAHMLRAVGRLRPGVSLAEARGNLEAAAARLERLYPETNRHMGAGLTPLREWWVGERRPALLLLLGAVGLVLLIACANLANLQLARATGRWREMALRQALGAGRGRLLRQLLVENLLLAAIAGTAGLLTAGKATSVLVALGPADLPRAAEIGLHPVVLAFALGLTLATALLFGLAPALSATRAPGQLVLVPGRSATSSGTARKARHGLVVVEVALATMLVAGAGLLLRSFERVRQVDPGFRADHVLVVELRLPGKRYQEDAQVAAFYERLRERAAALPGVVSVALADGLPPTGAGWTGGLAIAGRPAGRSDPEFHHRLVSPAYFKTLRVPLRRGRLFAASDDAQAPPVALINERLARQFFPASDPVGQRVALESKPGPLYAWHTIVGVVGDERLDGLAAGAPPQIYSPFPQAPEHGMFLLLRTAADPLPLAAPVRAAVREIDRDLPLLSAKALDGILDHSLAGERFLMLLMAAFGAAALALAAVGIAAVVAYNVGQRTRELGIRMALGATASQVVRLTLGEATAHTALGIALGGFAALGLSRLLRSLLFATSPNDPGTFGLTAFTLVAIALLAAYLPARRALDIDPAISLRQE